MWIRILRAETLTGGRVWGCRDVCWGVCAIFSRTQKSVNLSFTEAEYVALAAGIKETICLRYIWSFIFPDRDVGCSLV